MDLGFRPTRPGDLALLSQWLSAPHVQRWWPDEADLDSITAKYLTRIDRTDPTETFIVESDGAPVAFIQRYVLADNPDWRTTLARAIGAIEGVGIDYFIGDPTRTGRGLGTELIGRLVEWTFAQDSSVPAVVVSVQQENVASWRALEAAGFVRVYAGLLASTDPSDRGPAYVYVRQREGMPTVVATTVDPLFEEIDLARLYDGLCPWPERDDLEFYLPMVMDAPSVLDVGCGTGQLLRQARDRGHRGRLVGLDPAVGMLEVARTDNRVEWVLGDLLTTTWTSSFDLIVMTGHAFQVLVTDAQLHATLSRMRAALTHSGRVAFETRNPTARAWERWVAAGPVEVESADGPVLRRVDRVDEPVGDLVTFSGTYTSASWPAPRASTSTLRFLDARALEDVLTGADLEIDELFGDWNKGPLHAGSPEIIVIAHRSRH